MHFIEMQWIFKLIFKKNCLATLGGGTTATGKRLAVVAIN